MNQIDVDGLREELLQCRRCGLCRNAVYEDKGFDGICPVWKNSSGFETKFMRGKIMVALGLIDGVLERNLENTQPLYECTLCGNCTQICPSEFEPSKVLEQVRALLNDIPNPVRDSICSRINLHNNPYDEDNARRKDWSNGLGFDVPTEGGVIFFVGCTAGLRLPEIAKDAAKVMKSAGIDFAVMDDEPCCGSVMMRTGKMDSAVENARVLAKRFSDMGAKKIVVTCAGCMKTFKKDYASLGIQMPEVIHIIELARDLLESGELKPKHVGKDFLVTYHDPCHIGRELGIYEAPRHVLKAIPGIELVEMETNRNTAMCCGAGGGLRSYDSDMAKKIGISRIEDAELVGAEMIVSACPFCEHNLYTGIQLKNSKISVADVVTLLAQSLS